MPTNKEERLQILRMLEEGKISASEANKLLDAVDDDHKAPGKTRRNKTLRVAVSKNDTPQVNVALPVELARVALRFVPASAMSNGTIPDAATIMHMLEEGISGKIVDVYKEDENIRVELFLE